MTILQFPLTQTLDEDEIETAREEYANKYADERMYERFEDLDTYTLDEALSLGEESEVAKTIVFELVFRKDNSPVIVMAAIRCAVEKYIRDQLLEEGRADFDLENNIL